MKAVSLGLRLPRFAILACCLAGFLSQPSTLRAEDKTELSSADKSFINDAAEGGWSEVKAGELAKEKSKNAKVKSFAEMLVTDHSKANSKLKAMAKAKGVEAPAGPGLVQQGKLKLLGLKDDGFDKAFADQSVSDHKSTIDMFEKAIKELKDADLKAFAEKTLPTLKHHLSEAEKLHASLEKAK